MTIRHPEPYAVLHVGAAALALLLAASSHAQNFDDVEIQTRKLGGGVAMLVGQGGNIGVSTGDDGILLIDDQFAPLAGKISAAVAALRPGTLRFLVNTHWHGDHTGGNEVFGASGSVIIAHDNVRARMSTEQFMARRNLRIPPSPRVALPLLTYGDEVTFHLNGDTVQVRYVGPAHTDGDSMIHFRDANVIHMGDTYFNGMYPFVDLSSGGSVEGMLGAVNLGLGLANDRTKIIPGHGPLSNRAELRRYRNMLATVIERVGAEHKAGRSREETIAAKPTRDLDGAWARGFIKPDDFVASVYESLAGS